MKYKNCKWCEGMGCLACKAEADKEYKKQFPDGPKPIATFKLDDPEDMKKANKAVGRKALEKAFGPGGGGVDEIIDNCEKL